MSQEKLKSTYEASAEISQSEKDNHQERIRQQHEHEKTPHEAMDKEEASRDALEKARAIEREEMKPVEREQDRRERRRKDVVSEKEKTEAYKEIMQETQSHLKPSSRAFSKVIHNPVVEKTSEALGSTVARPNAILAGSATAFFTVLIVYLVARHYGYPLSGTETIASFVIGWMVGITFDFLKLMVTGKKS